MEDMQYELDENQEDFSNTKKENHFYPVEFDTNGKKMKELTLDTILKKTTTTGLNISEAPNVQEIVNNINGIIDNFNRITLPYPDLEEIPLIKIKNDEYLKSEVKISSYFNRINIDNNNNKFFDRRYNLCNNCHINDNAYYCQRCKKNLCKKCRENIEICSHSFIDIIDLGKLLKNLEPTRKRMFEMINKIFMNPKQEKPKEQLQKIYNEKDLDIGQNKKEIDDIIDSYKKTDDIELIVRIIGANYINYFHYINIVECEEYLKNRYDKCFNKCCLIINYKVDEIGDRIQIFGDNFVNNNKDKLFLIINNCYSELIPTIKINDVYLEVILVQKSEVRITNLSYMFQQCINLDNFDKYKDHDLIDFNYLEDISFMFNNCNKIEKLNLDLFGIFEKGKLKSMKETFSECTLLKKISGIDKWNIKNVETMAGMFKECPELSNIDGIEKFDTQNVKDFSEMFYECETLKSIPDISNWDMGKVESLKEMFKNCRNLEELPKISNWSKTIKNVTTMEKMFKGCSKLKSLPDFSQWDMSNVLNIAKMFKNCRAIKSFPDYLRWKNLKKNIVKTEGIFDKCPFYKKK